MIDTIGQKVGPLSMVDAYGTPFSAALHVIERYRLIDEARLRADANHQAPSPADGTAHGAIHHEAQAAHHLLLDDVAPPGQRLAHPLGSAFIVQWLSVLHRQDRRHLPQFHLCWHHFEVGLKYRRSGGG